MILNRLNADIFYELSGPKEAPLIVFANSLGTDLRVWDAMLPYLSGFQFLRFDKRGHGKSIFTGEFGMADLVQDAIAVIEAVGGKDVVFVGLSIGGMIGQGVCAERPDLVRAFVMMDSAARIGNDDFWAARIDAIRKHGLAHITGPLMARWFTKKFRDAGHDTKWRKMVENTSAEGYIGCCNAIAHTDLLASTAQLGLPVLALVGAEDGATPPDMVRETAELINGAQFKIIRGAGHLPCVEQPQITADLINAFIQSLK